MAETHESLVEEREELMLSSSSAKHPIFRKALFLKSSLNGGVANPPPPPPPPQPRNVALHVSFYQWRAPTENFVTWVQKMAALHQQTWRKAGIFDAIMASTFEIHKNENLVLEFVEKWCPDTKSFVFSWGEATITLEDVMILLGFPVLGCPVFGSLESDEMVGTREKLEKARLEMNKTTHRKPYQLTWMKRFMDSDEEIEHEAFLAFWLSRFVFPSSVNVIVKDVFEIAVRLARGIRLALAPAVLASFYRDLGDLKGRVVALNEDKITLWSPFQLVQVWAWERFPGLRPEPNRIENGDPRLARWHKVKRSVKNVSEVLDSVKDNFVWRPYAKPMQNWNVPKFYAEKVMWVSAGPNLDDEFLSFARCLRPSELVGMYCVEQYLPNRVGRQFGFDQDLPGYVARSNASPETAWNDYNKPIPNFKLHIRSLHFKAGMTKRYLDWWKPSVSSKHVASKRPVKVQKSNASPKIALKKSNQTSTGGTAKICDELIDLYLPLKHLKLPADSLRQNQKSRVAALDGKKSSKPAQNLKLKKDVDNEHASGGKKSGKPAQNLKRTKDVDNGHASGCSSKRLKKSVESSIRKHDHGCSSSDCLNRSSLKPVTGQKGKRFKVSKSPISSAPPKEPANRMKANGMNKDASGKARSVKELPLSQIIEKELENSAPSKNKGAALLVKGASKLAKSLNRKKGVNNKNASGFCSAKSSKLSLKSLNRKNNHVHASKDDANKSSENLAACQKEKGNSVADSPPSSPIPEEPAPVLKENGIANDGSGKASPVKEQHLNHVMQKELNNSPFPPGFPPKCKGVKAGKSTAEDDITIVGIWRSVKKHDKPINRKGIENDGSSSFSSDAAREDNITIAEISKSSKEHVSRGEASNQKNPLGESEAVSDSVPKTVKDLVNNKESDSESYPDCHKKQLLSGSVNKDSLHDVDNRNKEEGASMNPSSQSQSLSSSVSDTVNDNTGHLETMPRKTMQKGAAKEGSERSILDEGMVSNTGSPVEEPVCANGVEDRDSCAIEVPGFELEARIIRLERIFAELTASKLTRKFGDNC